MFLHKLRIENNRLSDSSFVSNELNLLPFWLNQQKPVINIEVNRIFLEIMFCARQTWVIICLRNGCWKQFFWGLNWPNNFKRLLHKVIGSNIFYLYRNSNEYDMNLIIHNRLVFPGHSRASLYNKHDESCVFDRSRRCSLVCFHIFLSLRTLNNHCSLYLTKL